MTPSKGAADRLAAARRAGHTLQPLAATCRPPELAAGAALRDPRLPRGEARGAARGAPAQADVRRQAVARAGARRSLPQSDEKLTDLRAHRPARSSLAPSTSPPRARSRAAASASPPRSLACCPSSASCASRGSSRPRSPIHPVCRATTPFRLSRRWPTSRRSTGCSPCGTSRDPIAASSSSSTTIRQATPSSRPWLLCALCRPCSTLDCPRHVARRRPVPLAGPCRS
jgi:hypothetical protein